MNLLALVLSVILLAEVSIATDFKDCGSKHGKIASVTVQGCTNGPCILKRGSTINFKVDFSSLEVSQTATAVVHGIIGSVPIPFPIPQTDACKYGGLACPLTENTNYTYSLDMPIQSSFPALDVTVKWELQDGNNEDLFCFEIDAKIE